jgi:hypothetical protein
MAGMLRLGFYILLAVAAAGAAQVTPAKPAAKSGTPAAKEEAPLPPPPPKVDRALRARVQAFYQAQLDGKYRQAEQYVAEESKDFFYGSEKQRYLSFEISKITYSLGYAEATVVVRRAREVTSQIGKMTFNVPEQSHWKIEKGLWCFLANQKAMATPFGPVSPGQPRPGELLGGKPLDKPAVATPQRPWNPVSVNKSEVRLPAAGGSDVTTLRNLMTEMITFELQVPETPGLQVTAERLRIARNYTSDITFTYAPKAGVKPPKELVVNIHVKPTDETIPVRVVFDGPKAGK